MRGTLGVLVALCAFSTTGCRRVAPRPAVRAVPRALDAVSRDAVSVDATPDADVAAETAATIGPPDPWADSGSADGVPVGPEADRTRATMTALRAAIGFWRIERNARTNCPRLEDLARVPSSGFDPLTMQTDAWGSPFAVECLGARVRIRSWGSDRVRETGDDIVTQ